VTQLQKGSAWSHNTNKNSTFMNDHVYLQIHIHRCYHLQWRYSNKPLLWEIKRVPNAYSPWPTGWRLDRAAVADGQWQCPLWSDRPAPWAGRPPLDTEKRVNSLIDGNINVSSNYMETVPFKYLKIHRHCHHVIGMLIMFIKTILLYF